jgi:hypothetical protein
MMFDEQTLVVPTLLTRGANVLGTQFILRRHVKSALLWSLGFGTAIFRRISRSIGGFIQMELPLPRSR